MPVMRPDDVGLMVREGYPLKLDLPIEPRFREGDRVLTRNLNPHHHTRLPRYARAKLGTVVRDHGVYPFPDTNAHGEATPQHVYVVRFTAREIWGNSAAVTDTLCLDLWDDHLDPAPEGR